MFNRDTLEIMRQEDTGNDTESIINLNDVIHSPIEINREIIGKNENEGLLVDGKDSIALDMSVLDPKHKIILRHWRQGDRFKPFGMKGTKLLSDIFSDAKLSEKEKHDVWLMEIDSKIVWIIGIRTSIYYSVGEKSTKYLRLEYARK